MKDKIKYLTYSNMLSVIQYAFYTLPLNNCNILRALFEF